MRKPSPAHCLQSPGRAALICVFAFVVQLGPQWYSAAQQVMVWSRLDPGLVWVVLGAQPQGLSGRRVFQHPPVRYPGCLVRCSRLHPLCDEGAAAVLRVQLAFDPCQNRKVPADGPGNGFGRLSRASCLIQPAPPPPPPAVNPPPMMIPQRAALVSLRSCQAVWRCLIHGGQCSTDRS